MRQHACFITPLPRSSWRFRAPSGPPPSLLSILPRCLNHWVLGYLRVRHLSSGRTPAAAARQQVFGQVGRSAAASSPQRRRRRRRGVGVGRRRGRDRSRGFGADGAAPEQRVHHVRTHGPRRRPPGERDQQALQEAGVPGHVQGLCVCVCVRERGRERKREREILLCRGGD